jgi:hypothetical protein
MEVDLYHHIAGDRTAVGRIHLYLGCIAEMHVGFAQPQLGEFEI